MNSANSVTTRIHSSRMRTAHNSTHLLGEGVCLSACWDTHSLGVGLETPQVWAWRHPLGVDLETPWGVWAWRLPRLDPSTPPWVWAWRPKMHAGIPPPPPPMNKITDTCKKHNLAPTEIFKLSQIDSTC